MDKFYMVFVDGRNTPSRVYDNIDEAETEAERLCEKEKRKTFVLKAVCKFELKNIEKTIL